MTEIIDIINKHDEVVGQTTREESERLGYLRRFVHVFVRDEQGRILFQQRHHTKKSCPLQLDASAGGHVMANESYHDAAKRELEEELGLTGDVHEIGPITGHQKIGRLFIFEYNNTMTLRVMENEIECIDWLTVEEIKYLVSRHPYFIAGGTLSSWEVYCKQCLYKE
ncbi:MAG: NUDIX domain-containing protein [Candidatus Absconditabacterales bacterium]|nr:NUDIX domain-containing protein [Candidatus Absconditabacterales bacterium]